MWLPPEKAAGYPDATGPALESTVLAPIWTTNMAKPFLVPFFSFIIILSFSQNSHSPKMNIQAFGKNNFILDFSQILKLRCLFLFF
jgi:hypothetical protein